MVNVNGNCKHEDENGSVKQQKVNLLCKLIHNDEKIKKGKKKTR